MGSPARKDDGARSPRIQLADDADSGSASPSEKPGHIDDDFQVI